jgi:hypothetical protein
MNERPKWTEVLNDEDWSFIKRFVLASGSLKDLAAGYGISYPTIRQRLDRLMAKIQALESEESADDFEYLLRALYAEGRVEKEHFKELLAAHRREMRRKK